MAEIKFSWTGVSSTLGTVSSTFENISEKISDIKSKTSEVGGYWQTREATTFLSRVGEVENNLNAFIEKYEAYMKFLDSVVAAYTADNENLVNAINAISAGK